MNDYYTITELPGTQVTELQIRRSYQRYTFASNLIKGGYVLEVGCGGGQGLSLLNKNAEKVIGCDIDKNNLKIAQSTYRDSDSIDIIEMSAEKLEFEENFFSAIIVFETIYYIKDIKSFLKKCFTLLNKDGKLIICSANKDWPEFNPSPFSTKYFSVPELNDILSKEGFSVNLFGGFPDKKDSTKQKTISLIKKIAVYLHLIPRTMKGKVLLKKLFLGKTVLFPKKLDDQICNYLEPKPISKTEIDNINTAIFAVAKK